LKDGRRVLRRSMRAPLQEQCLYGKAHSASNAVAGLQQRSSALWIARKYRL
jgi:hypothetical protein